WPWAFAPTAQGRAPRVAMPGSWSGPRRRPGGGRISLVLRLWCDHVAAQHKSSEYVIIAPQLVVIIEIYGGKNQQVPEAFDLVPDLPPPPSQGARAVPGCLAHPGPGAAAAGAGGAGPGRPRAP